MILGYARPTRLAWSDSTPSGQPGTPSRVSSSPRATCPRRAADEHPRGHPNPSSESSSAAAETAGGGPRRRAGRPPRPEYCRSSSVLSLLLPPPLRAPLPHCRREDLVQHSDRRFPWPGARPQSNRGLGAGRRSSPPRTATRGAARRRRRRSTRPPGPETLRCSCRCRGGAPDLTGRCRCRQGRCRWPLALAVGIGTVEAPDILLLGHSGRDKRGGHRRGGGRIGPGVDTKWGGLWRRDERQC